MVEKNYIIIDDAGIHARPSKALVHAATPFRSEVTLEYNGGQVNLKSIMGVMSLGIPKGANVKVVAKSDDELEVISSIDENGKGRTCQIRIAWKKCVKVIVNFPVFCCC